MKELGPWKDLEPKAYAQNMCKVYGYKKALSMCKVFLQGHIDASGSASDGAVFYSQVLPIVEKLFNECHGRPRVRQYDARRGMGYWEYNKRW